MPEPAYFSIGLAMKQAVTPCRRACGAHQPLQHDEIVGGLQHVLAVVAASARTGRAHIRRSPSRPECPAPGSRHRCRKTAAPCRADGRPNRPRSCRSCGRRARRSAGCTRPSASRSLASRKNSSSKAPAGCRPFAGQRRRPAAPARGAGRTSSAAPSRWYIDISTWPRAGCVPCSGTSVPGIGQPRRSPSPESQIRPVSWTSSPVMSRPRIEIGRCRPPS